MPTGVYKRTEFHRKLCSLASKGRKMSEKQKAAIAAAHVGIPRSEETKRKISQSNKGKKLSFSHRQKLSLGQRNKSKDTLETRLRKSIGLRGKYLGEKHHSWKGGKTPENKRIRNSSIYKHWRKKVFERDNFTCVFCKRNDVKVFADHIKPFSLYPELRLEISNGRTLCLECHKKTKSFARNKPLEFCSKCLHCQT